MIMWDKEGFVNVKKPKPALALNMSLWASLVLLGLYA